MISTPLQLAVALSRVLDNLGIQYVVGGGVASAILGEPRTTVDVDIVTDLSEESVSRLLTALGPDFYFDRETATAAVRQRRSFNVIHLPTSIKADFFVIPDSDEERTRLSRHALTPIDASGDVWIKLHSPEDLIIWKLRWFRAGDDMSDRQWRDALGILKIQGADLNFRFLKTEAAKWGVAELLETALVQAGLQT